MTTPKPILQVVADTPTGQTIADSLIKELRAKGFTVSGSAGDVLIAVIAPGASPLPLMGAARTAGTPIVVVAVGALPPRFAGSEYSIVEPVRHDTAIPGRTAQLVEDALDEVAAMKTVPPKPILQDETPILRAAPPSPPPKSSLPAKPNDASKNRFKDFLNSPLGSQIVGGLVVALLLGILGFLGSRLIPGASPAATETPTATATLPPSTDTHTPTDAPTLTPTGSPTLTPTLEPTATDAPTNTPSPATDTPIPATATNTPETAVVVEGGIEIQLFITDDTLTFYSAESSEIIPQLRIRDADGEIHALTDYSALNGIPFDFVNPPLCIVLRLSDADSPFPQVCQNLPNPNNLFRHPLTQADVFWYDAVQGERALVILVGDTTAGYCPAGQAECAIQVPGQ